MDGVAFLAGTETSSTFMPTSYGQSCGRGGCRGGCRTVTNGVLSNGASVVWDSNVPLGQPFGVREPLWGWGFGSGLVDGRPTAIIYIFLGLLFDGIAVFLLFLLFKLARNWLRHRQQGRALAGSGWQPSR